MHRKFSFEGSGRRYVIDAEVGPSGFALSATCDGNPVKPAQAARFAPAGMRPTLDRLVLLDGCDLEGVPLLDGDRVGAVETMRRQLVDHVANGRVDAADRVLRSAVSTTEIEDAYERAAGVVKRVFLASRKEVLCSTAEAMYSTSASAKDSLLPGLALRSVRSGYSTLAKALGNDFRHCGFPDVAEPPRDRKAFDGLMNAVARQAVFFNSGLRGRGTQEYLRNVIRRNAVEASVTGRLLPVAMAAWNDRAQEAIRHMSAPETGHEAGGIALVQVTVERGVTAGTASGDFDGVLAMTSAAEEGFRPSI